MVRTKTDSLDQHNEGDSGCGLDAISPQVIRTDFCAVQLELLLCELSPEVVREGGASDDPEGDEHSIICTRRLLGV